MQTNELESVKRKIRALTERTVDKGFTEAEAVIAFTKVGELLERFNLEMSEVMLREEPCISEYFNTGSKHKGVVFNSMMAIGSFCQVKVWQNRHTFKDGIAACFFGLESDVKMAIYLCQLISEATSTAYAEFKESDVYKNYGSHRRTLAFSFYNGMSSRLDYRLHEIRQEQKKQTERAAYHREQAGSMVLTMSDEAAVKVAEQKTGTALMEIAKKDKVEAEFKRMMGLKLKKNVSRSSANHSGAYYKGRDAGDKVNLSRPLANKGYGGTLLLT